VKCHQFLENKKKQEELIEGLRNEFIKVHQRYQLPVGDFPDITRFKEVLSAHNDFTKFAKLNEKMILAMDEVLANDIPKLMQQFPTERDAINSSNPFENASPFDVSFASEGPISQEEFNKSKEIFQTLGPVDGKITGKAATTILTQSKLPREVLSKIWVLSDRDKDGLLNQEEFAISLWLVKQTLEGKPVPYVLPPSLQISPSQKMNQQPPQQPTSYDYSNPFPNQQNNYNAQTTYISNQKTLSNEQDPNSYTKNNNDSLFFN